jgi:hypothetical protein
MADEKSRDVTGQYESPVELVRRAEREASKAAADSASKPDPALADEGSADGPTGAAHASSRNGQ